MNYETDFASVDLILKTDLETRGVDSFILSFIKCEKQARRLFTFLIFQNPSYSLSDYSALRTTLAKNRNIYFSNFIKGINLIAPKPISTIYGSDYNSDINNIILFANDRNKIFHGQITSSGLTRKDLIDRVNAIQKWCMHLGHSMKNEIGYDGFSDSYVKASYNIAIKNTNKFDTLTNYEQFLKVELK